MLHKFKSRRFPTGKGEGTFTAAVEAAGIEDAPDLVVECFPHSKDIQFAATLCRELARKITERELTDHFSTLKNLIKTT